MSTLTVFSLNSFGTPTLFGWRRMMQMGRELNQRRPDLLCLQEVQANRYLPALAGTLNNTPFMAFQKNRRRPQGGLLTTSRVPYSQWAFHPFPNRGLKWSIGYADWALNKGVLAVHLEVDGLPVVVLNTHLQANYLAGWKQEEFLARIEKDQVNFLAALVQRQDINALVVVCGDFNFPPHTFLYPELMERSGLIDPLALDPRPTYQPFPLVSSTWATRLDYALYRPPEGIDLTVTIDIIRIQNEAARTPWTRFLTDHFLLSLSLTWARQAGFQNTNTLARDR